MILNNIDYKIVTIKEIPSQQSMMYIEDLSTKSKPSTDDKLKILISSTLLQGKDIKLLSGFRFSETELEFVGLDVVIPVEIFTRLNIPKKLIYLEEFPGGFRLTFSSSLVVDLRTADLIEI